MNPAQPAPVFGLKRLGELLGVLGRPQDQQRFIHLTGTSGKTSTATMIAGLLHGQGDSCALHVSPHLHRVCERLTINGEPVSKQVFIELLEAFRPILDKFYRERDFAPVSYFEGLLALALWHFQKSKAEWTVLEAGLGGRYDGTNVIDRAVVSLVTSIGLDHTHILGETRELIARDKIGILKPGGTFLTAEQEPGILEIFREHCLEFGNSMEVLDQDFCVKAYFIDRGLLFDYQSADLKLDKIRLGVCGDFQVRNAGLALRATEKAFQSVNRGLDEEKVRLSFASLQVPGRFEVLADRPPVIVDGAHNEEKMKAFVVSVKRSFPETVFSVVYAATPGRRLEAVFEQLQPLAHELLLTRTLATFRGTEDPKVLREIVRNMGFSGVTEIYLDPFAALGDALKSRRLGYGVIVTGSLYLVSDLRQWLQRFVSSESFRSQGLCNDSE